MYTTLRLDDLKQTLRVLIGKIFAMKLTSSRARHLLVRDDGTHEWVNSLRTLTPGKEYIFNADTLSSMMLWLRGLMLSLEASYGTKQLASLWVRTARGLLRTCIALHMNLIFWIV